MLTNNKKSFVRSISMLLAMLMVLAVCLTGCGNKAADEALTKAEEAQNAADAAQGTADAAKSLADEVKAALADYLKTADAVTEAKVNELIDAALADGVATAADVEALAAKVTAHLGTAHLTKAEVTALIKAEVAANAVKDAMTKAQVLEILKDYYTKTELDAKLDEELATYFGEFDAATVQKLLKDVEKAMNEEEWDKASAIVIETIDSMQDLMTEIFTKTYTQANMKKVNDLLKPLGIVAFPTSGDKLVKIAGAEAQAKFQKNLEYTILRVASVEKMEELKAAVDAALAVPTFEKQLAALEQQLYDLGEYVQYGSYSGNTFTAEKWPNADGTYKYHNKTYAKNTAKETQVVTLNDKADFYAWIDAYDALYTEYIADGALSVAQAEGKTVKNVFTKAGSNNTVEVAVDTAATKSGYTKVGQTVVWDETGLVYLNNKYGTTKIPNSTVYYLPITVLNNVVAQMDETLYTTHSVETQWKSTGKYGYAGNEKVYSDVNLVAEPEMVRAYSAIVKQLQECQTAANEANDTFDAFQLVIYNDSNLKTVQTTYSKVTDAQLLEYLAASMCESNGVTVHNVYLDPQVNKEMTESYALNGKTAAGINEYPLYEQMKDKAFDLLWVKYKTQASEWADQILKDYISIVYEAKDNSIAINGSNGPVAATYTDTTSLANAMTAGGEQTVAAQLSEGFVDAFVTGADLTAEIYTKLGVAANYKTDNLAKFYANNGVAKYVDPASVGATQMAYEGYMANPLNSIKTNAEDIRQRLTGAMLSVDIAIAGANMQEMKASGVAVQKAFYEILKAGVANLEEIYDRFLLEDYKFMTYNEMLLKSDAIVNFYGAKTGLADAMQQYLTAVSTAGVYGGDVAKDKDSKITSWTPGANAAEATLTNGKLVADISAVTINKYATSDSVETVKVGRDAMKQIDKYAAEATAKIENVAVKVNFLSYLETARMEWSDVFQGYYKAVKTANVNDFDTMIKLSLLSSEVDDTITVVEYYANHGGLELDTYKENYIEVLAMISNNDAHTALLSGKTIEEILADSSIAGKAFAEAQKAVKGLTALPSGATWVVEPLVPAVASTYVGSAVVDLDKIVNGAASYKKDNVTTKLYN